MALASKYENPYSTRRSLLSRVRNPDDQASWQTFFDTYSKLAYSVAAKAGLTHVEAQEVVQETFISLMKTMPTFKYDPTKSFKAWLIHTTQYKVCDQLRKRKRRPLRTPTTKENGATRTATIERIPDPASLNVEAIFDDEWREHLFEIAVEKVKQQVTASHYQIFDLYVLKKWPVSKIATTLGIRRGKIYLVKHRVSHLVKQQLKLLKDEMH